MEGDKAPPEGPRVRKLWHKAAVAAAILLGAAAATLHYSGAFRWFSNNAPAAPDVIEPFISRVFVLSTEACELHQRSVRDEEKQRIYRAAYEAINQKFGEATGIEDDYGAPDYSTYDVDFDSFYKGATDCSEDSLKQRAKSLKRTVDVFVLYRVETDEADNLKVDARAVIGEFLVGQEDITCAKDSACDREDAPSDQARALAGNVGLVLTETVSWPVNYTVNYQGLEEGNFEAIKEQVSDLLENRGYREISVRSEPGDHYFLYQTVSGEWNLSAQVSSRYLANLLRDGKAWGVQLEQDGREITLKRIFLPLRAVLFILVVVGILILVVVGYEAVVVIYHGRILADHTRNIDGSKGLQHLENARRHWLFRFVPERPRWRTYEKEFEAKQKLRNEVDDVLGRSDGEMSEQEREQLLKVAQKLDLKEQQLDDIVAWRREKYEAESSVGWAAWLAVMAVAVVVVIVAGVVLYIAWPVEDRLHGCEWCPELVEIPAGQFSMGTDAGEEDEEPVRDVQVRRFALARHETTVGQFLDFATATGYLTDAERDRATGCWTLEIPTRGKWDWTPGRSWHHLEYRVYKYQPVTCVSWNDAQAYVRWLNEKTGGGWRLPSEAEWEYAARAGSEKLYHFGDDASRLCDYGNVADSTEPPGGFRLNWKPKLECSDDAVYPTRVGSYWPNALGLRDMHGSVYEWTVDCWYGSYRGAPTDGSAWESGDCDQRVRRGGAWSSGASILRTANRESNPPSYRSATTGFRVARTLAP